MGKLNLRDGYLESNMYRNKGIYKNKKFCQIRENK